MKCFLVAPESYTRVTQLGPDRIVKRRWHRQDRKETKWCDEWAPAQEFPGGALFYSDTSCTLPYGENLWLLLSTKVRYNLDQKCECGTKRFHRVGEPPNITITCCSKHPVIWRLENGELIEA
jgi:hypothetical protein